MSCLSVPSGSRVRHLALAGAPGGNLPAERLGVSAPASTAAMAFAWFMSSV
jgi:hypothetical protein